MWLTFLRKGPGLLLAPTCPIQVRGWVGDPGWVPALTGLERCRSAHSIDQGDLRDRFLTNVAVLPPGLGLT